MALRRVKAHQDNLRGRIVRRPARRLEQLSLGLVRSHAEVAEFDAEPAVRVLEEEEVLKLGGGGVSSEKTQIRSPHLL